MSNRPQKIAFYGGMANNCYLVCSRMRELGFDAIYIRDRLDNYAISQPMWEDHPFTMGYEDLIATSGWTAERWDELAREKGWVTPEWVVDPDASVEEGEPDRSVIKNADLMTVLPSPANHPHPAAHYRKIIALMRKQDLVFVSNVHAIIVALFSGVRFVICPAGGEFLLASRILKEEGAVGRTLEQQGRLLMIAFQRAAAVLTNTAFLQHRSLTGGIWPLLRDYHRVCFERVSLPYVCTTTLSKNEKRDRLNAFLVTQRAPPVVSKYAMFVPSRIDYKWKAQDRLIDALALAHRPEEFTFIFSGWGADYADFRERTRNLGSVRMLGSAFSKPVLYDIYRSVDCVVDQFTLGHIGSAAREACSVGTPVMAWIEGLGLGWPFRPELPVLNARTTNDIAATLDKIAHGCIDLSAAGQRAQMWITEYSDPGQMGRALTKHASVSPKTPARDLRSKRSETSTP
jgi:hypothetical protein